MTTDTERRRPRNLVWLPNRAEALTTMCRGAVLTIDRRGNHFTWTAEVDGYKVSEGVPPSQDHAQAAAWTLRLRRPAGADGRCAVRRLGQLSSICPPDTVVGVGPLFGTSTTRRAMSCGRDSCVAGLNPSHRFRNWGSFFKRVVRLFAEPCEAQAAFWLSAPQVTVTTFPAPLIAMGGEGGGATGRRDIRRPMT